MIITNCPVKIFLSNFHQIFKDTSYRVQNDKHNCIFNVSKITCKIFASKVSTATLLSGAESLAHHKSHFFQFCRITVTSFSAWCFWLARSLKLWSNIPFKTVLTWNNCVWLKKNSYQDQHIWQNLLSFQNHFWNINTLIL